MQNIINKLRERPKDEQVAVASATAVAVVVVLVIVWAISFFRTIRDTDINVDTINVPSGAALNLEGIDDVREQLIQNYNGAIEAGIPSQE